MASLAEMKNQGGGAVSAVANPVKAKLQLLDKRKDLLGSGASQSIVVDREIRAAGVMLMNNKDIQDSSIDTFYTAVSLGINSGIGFCNGRGYLVAYKGKCSFVPGWKGLIDLVSRTGRANAWTGVIYKGDQFDWQLGSDPYLHHKPQGDSDTWKDATHIYAIGRIKDQEYPIIEVWTIKKVIKHLNKYNKVGSKHYALKDDNNMEMYARKVVLLQAIKYLPTSQDIEKAINADIAADAGLDMTIDGEFVNVPDTDDQGTGNSAQASAAHVDTENGSNGNTDAGGAPDDLFQGVETVLAGQMPQRGQNGGNKLEAFKKRLQDSKDVDMLDADADLIRTFPEAEQEELKALYKQRRSDLEEPFPSGRGKAQGRVGSKMNLE